MRLDIKKNAAQIAVIGAVALLARLVYLEQMASDPLFDIPVAASKTYVDLARQALPWDAIGPETPAFLYCLFLKAVFDLVGEDYASVRHAQAVVGALNCLLLWSLARRLSLPGPVPLIAALAAALYGPFIYLDGALRPTVLATFFSLLALCAAVWALSRRRAAGLWIAGLVSGLAALFGAHLLLFAPVASWWIWRRARFAAGAAGLVFGFAAVVALGAAVHGWPWGAGVSLSAAGLYDLLRGQEVLVDDPYYASQHSSLLAALLWVRGLAFPFGLAGPLGLAGIGYRLRDPGRSPAETILLLFLGTYLAVAFLFESDAAGRAVAVPVLLLIAAAGACTWLRASWSRRGPGFGAFLLLCLGLNVYQGVSSVRAEQHHWRGYAYLQADMVVNAQGEYEAAVLAGSERVDTYLSLADLYGAGGDFSRGAAVFEKLLQRWPDNTEARWGLAHYCMGAERFAEAAAAFEELVAVDPDEALPVLAKVRMLTGDQPGALRAYEQLSQRQPDNGTVCFLTALLYVEEGRAAEAIEAYRGLLDDPGWRERAAARMAQLLVEAGQTAEAESVLRRTLSEVNPKSENALALLGKLLFQQQRFEEALVHFERLRPLQRDDYQVYYFLTRIYLELGRRAEAEEARDLYERYRLQKHRADIRKRMEEEANLMLRQIMDQGK